MHSIARNRVLEDQFRGVQELPRDPPSELLCPRPLRRHHPPLPTDPVDGIADDGMSDVHKVHTNLVRTPCLERHAQEVDAGPALADDDTRERGEAVLRDGHPFPVLGVPADGGIDGQLVIGQMSPHGGLIQTLHVVTAEGI